MPPKKAPKGKLHELAVEVPAGFKFRFEVQKKDFVLGKQFATGGFGRIYTCNEVGKKEELCVKVEPAGNGPLFTELAVFQRALKPDVVDEYCKKKGIKTLGVPVMLAFGIFEFKNEKLRYLVMPKYATSLEAVREKSGGKFDAKTAFTVAKAIARSLEYLQSKAFTHGDIKAANILLSKAGDFAGSVLVDYGLARSAGSNEEKADKKRAHNGTAIFTSLDAHRGFQPSYRGDLEILVYNIVYWLTGTLPWASLESNAAAVQDKKEALAKAPESTLVNLLGSAVGKPVADLYLLSQKTGYKEAVDYDKAVALIDKAAASSSKASTPKAAAPPVREKKVEAKEKKVESKAAEKKTTPARKRIVLVATSDEEEEEEEKKPAPSSRRGAAAVSARRRIPVVSSEEEEEEEREPTPPKRARLPVSAVKKTTAKATPKGGAEEAPGRQTRSRKRTGDEENSTPPAKRSSRRNALSIKNFVLTEEEKKEEEEEEEEESKEEEEEEEKEKEDEEDEKIKKYKENRGRRGAVPLIRSARTRKEVEEKEEEDDDEENGETDSDQNTTPAPAKRGGVDSATKGDRELLRNTVPGMRNFKKGRRSEIINKIADDYGKKAKK